MTRRLDKLLADGCSTDARHKVCRSRGGESCAFDGAAIVLVPIADAAHVVHGPIACAGSSWAGRGVRSDKGNLHRRGFTSDMTEIDIVYGGEDRLAATVREVVRRERPSAVFVYATCVTGLIGEALDAMCSKLAAELWVPVIPVNAPGFVGPKNLGNRIAGDTLLEHVIGTAEPCVVTPTDIALVGDYNVAGDQEYVDALLAECGIRVLSHVTGNARFDEIRWAHRAKLTAMVCSRALINVAAGLQRGWDVPFVEVGFFGAEETARSLRSIAEGLEAVSPEAVGVSERTESVIAERQSWLVERLVAYQDLRGLRAVLYSGGVKSWAMAAALRDLGIEVVAVGVKKSSTEDEEKVREVLGPDVPLLEDVSGPVMRRLMADADLLIAGGRNRYLAAKEGWPFVDVNQERERAYAGYEGLVNLADDIARSVRFYRRQRVEPSCATPASVVEVQGPGHAGAIDPIKHAPSLGAIMALQGVDRCLPVMHGAQGCSFLGKVLGIRHSNEPIAYSTTKLFTEDVVLGGPDFAAAAVRKLVDGARPSLVALVGGALSAVKGDDLAAAGRTLADEPFPTITIDAPDYDGGFEEGWRAAVTSLLQLAEEPHEPGLVDSRQVTVLAGAHLTAADARELRDMLESFRLQPVFVPDRSALDGSRTTMSQMASGGASVAQLRSIGVSAHTLVVGASLEAPARGLRERFGTPYTVVESVCALHATDHLLATLSLVSGRGIPERYERDRRVLVDALRDAQLLLSGSRIVVALDPDHALSVSTLLAECAAHVTAVVSTAPPHAARIPADRVIAGDFASVPPGCDLLVASSHGEVTAERLGVPLLETGFPVTGRYGAERRLHLGYRGATALVDDIANTLAAAHEARAHARWEGVAPVRSAHDASPGTTDAVCSTQPSLTAAECGTESIAPTRGVTR